MIKIAKRNRQWAVPFRYSRANGKTLYNNKKYQCQNDTEANDQWYHFKRDKFHHGENDSQEKTEYADYCCYGRSDDSE